MSSELRNLNASSKSTVKPPSSSSGPAFPGCRKDLRHFRSPVDSTGVPTPDLQPRCSHTTTDGRRCRNLRSPDHASLCSRHARRALAPSPLPPAPVHSPNDGPPTSDVSSALLGPIDDFRTAAAINHALGKLFILLAGNRIAPRQAAVLAYICQLLLQSLSEVKNEVNATYQHDDVHDELARVLDATSPLRPNDAMAKGNT